MLSQRQLIWRKFRSMFVVGASGTVAFGGIGVWSGNEKFYQQFVSPLLQQMDPEVSHRAAVVAAKMHIIRSSTFSDPPNLETNLGSLKLPNPVGIAAGFDKSGECMSGLVRMGVGWVEIGSVTPLPQEGNPKPRVFRLPEDSAVINRYGFNNDGHTEVLSRVQDFKKNYPTSVIGINLGANKESPDRIRDYCIGIEAFSDTADYFVINISSPNTPNLRELQKSESLKELLEKVIATRDKQSRKVPLLLKVAPDLTEADIKSICRTVSDKKTRIDGLIVSNTTVSRDSLNTNSSIVNETGGLSGKPLEKMSTELVRKFYNELKGEIPIIGVGGVWDGADAYRKIKAGASAVQIYTALTYKGPGIINRIKSELSTLLTEEGFNSVKDAVGIDQKRR